MIRNYFADLELEYWATGDDIRQAYRRLARRFHPDLNPEDCYAEESFKRIQEAYRYLEDRERADRLRRRLKAEVPSLDNLSRWSQEPSVPASVPHFMTQWKEERTSRTQSKKTRTGSSKRKVEFLDHSISLPVSDKEVKEGFEKDIQFEIEKPCPKCRTQGLRSKSIMETCKPCAGQGFRSIQRGNFQWKKTCEDCRGQGYLMRSRCLLCQGQGKIKVHEQYRLAWKGSSRPVKSLLLKSCGHISFDGKKRGNLWVHLVLG